MTKEDIERKCLEYSQAATPSYTNGTFDRYAIAQAYEDGAIWRINSVWHDEKVIPNRNLDKKIFGCGEDVILKPKYRQFFEICEVLWDEDKQKIYLSGERETFFMDDVEIWAYVSDLLPERKEETK